MAFTEKLKKEVKEKAAFRCCRCQNIGIEIHHIIPQGNDGSDTLENAAPLCPNCHSHFGDNPIKRKEITHMRDWWYKQAENMYPSNIVPLDELAKINSKLEMIHSKQTSDLSELKSTLKVISESMIDSITVENASIAASGIVNTAAFWNQSKNKLPLHQRIITETLFKESRSYDICWICGDDEQLSMVKVKNDDGEAISGIICDDCFAIQENMGTLFVERNPIKR